jgi:hypothetical protein
VAKKMTTDLAALGAGFTTVVGTTTVDLTEAQFRSGITTLETADVPGPYAAWLHPVQWADLVGSVGSFLDAAANTGASARQEMNDFGAAPGGDHGFIYEVHTITNSTVPTANAGADRAGTMFAIDRAIGFVDKWRIRPEMERKAALRGVELMTSAAYGVGELDDTSGVAIITDA